MEKQTILELKKRALIADWLKPTRTKLLKTIGVLILCNLLAFTLVTNGLGGLLANFIIGLYTFLIILSVLGFLLGLLVALLPYQKLSFKQKYVASSLVVIMVLQACFSIALCWLTVITVLDR